MRKRDLFFVILFICVYVFSVLFLIYLSCTGRRSIPLIVTVGVETLFMIVYALCRGVRRK